MKKKAPLKEKIKGIEWTFHVQNNAAYMRANGKDSEAITYPYEKEVYFNSSRLNPSVVRHEILHVYVASSGTHSSNLDADQREDLCCEIFEEHGPEMMVLTDKILNYFLR